MRAIRQQVSDGTDTRHRVTAGGTDRGQRVSADDADTGRHDSGFIGRLPGILADTVRRLSGGFPDTIRRRLMLLFLSTTLLSSVISLYVFFAFSNLTDNMAAMFETSTLLDGMLGDLEEANQNLYGFLTTRNNENLLNFSRRSDRLSAFVTASTPSMQRDLIMRDILHMIPSYLEEANLAIDARRARDPAYSGHYDLASRAMEHIRTYAQALNLAQLEKNTDLFRNQSRNIGLFKISAIVMITSMIALSILLVLYIIDKMTDPIVRLSHASEEIANGNFDTEEIPVSGEEEIRVMAQAFNRMKGSIRTYITELHDKRDTETMLLEQKMQNMKMQNLLDSSRLQSLQAQINPHFLFNTLNAGIQLSVMEGSDRTTEFLENLSDLFRYNIRKTGSTVSLQEEIQHVKAYVELMKVRFGDSIDFRFEVEESALSIGIPPLSIQTLVENACIHGLRNAERGTIRIRVEDQPHEVRIYVADDGCGMEADLVKDFFTRSRLEPGVPGGGRGGHSTGIGLTNVIQRLRLHSGVEDVMRIDSVVGEGTEVTILLPKPVRETVVSDEASTPNASDKEAPSCSS